VTVHRQNRAVGEAEHRVGEELTLVFDPAVAALLVD
jgi:hypothetical protein